MPFRRLDVDEKMLLNFILLDEDLKSGWTEVAKDRIHWPTPVNTEMTFRVRTKAGDILTITTTISFSRTMLHSKNYPELCLRIQVVPHSKHSFTVMKLIVNALW